VTGPTRRFRLARSSLLAPLLVAGLAIVVLVPGLGTYGLWEPHELRVAERAQALNHRNLERGEGAVLPEFVEPVVAASMRVFGTNELGSRVPVVVFGIIAFAATVGLGRRLGGWRAGTISGLILLSSPLFLFQSRLLSGDIAQVTSHALLFFGLAGVAWPERRRRGRATWGYLGDGLAIAAGAWLGYATMGALLGVAVPLTAGAFASAMAVSGELRACRARERGFEYLPRRLVIGSAVMVVLAAGAGLWVMVGAFELAPAFAGDRAVFGKTLVAKSGDLAALGGPWREHPDPSGTFHGLFEEIAYGFFPWSVLAPLALVAPAVALGSGRRAWAAYLVLASIASAWLACAFLARNVQPMGFPALTMLAVGVGLFLDDRLEQARRQDARPIPLAAIFVVLAAVVFAKDMISFPDKLVSVHLVNETIEVPGEVRGLILVVTGLGVLVAVALALSLLAGRPSELVWPGLSRLPVRTCIGASLLLSATFAGVLSHGWLPAMSERLSSRELFQAFEELAGPDDAVAILGGRRPGPALGRQASPEAASNAGELVKAFDRSQRVFGLIPRDRLCEVQAAASSRGVPYFVVYDGHAESLWVSNRLEEGQRDLSPLTGLLVRERPEVTGEPIEATFGDRIRLVGYDMPERVSLGESFEMTLYFEVLAPPRRDWKVFVHFDGPGARWFTADHAPAHDVCGTRYWREGDYIIDRFQVRAGGAGHPPGQHGVFVGFFVSSGGEWINKEVDDRDRVRLGTLIVE
jgi:4-amino-4-deoxy-L-arabinose transferase-like glycosyltransferase